MVLPPVQVVSQQVQPLDEGGEPVLDQGSPGLLQGPVLPRSGGDEALHGDLRAKLRLLAAQVPVHAGERGGGGASGKGLGEHAVLQERLAARLPGPIHALRHSTDDVAPPRFPAQTGVAQRPDGGGVSDVGRKTGDVQLMGYRPAPFVADRGQLRVEPALSVPQLPAARVLPPFL